jgi:hypothetical protein
MEVQLEEEVKGVMEVMEKVYLLQEVQLDYLVVFQEEEEEEEELIEVLMD